MYKSNDTSRNIILYSFFLLLSTSFDLRSKLGNEVFGKERKLFKNFVFEGVKVKSYVQYAVA